MPLHLLGKKSWNVYNPANIARVRRDEEAARAREQAEEQRLQEVDAERRLAILRGEAPPPLSPPRDTTTTTTTTTTLIQQDEDAPRRADRDRDRERWGGSRKRKRPGEDDTDFEMRVAREQVGDGLAGRELVVAEKNSRSGNRTSNAPLTDAAGHIDLFPLSAPGSIQKNAEAEAEKKKKEREYEDQYTMRFSNAAGYKTSLSGPWYTGRGETKDLVERDSGPGKDVWGNDDPRRKDREAVRVVASDPLAMMKRGAAKVREVEKERRVINEEKERELKELKREERRREKKRRRRRHEHEEKSQSPEKRHRHREDYEFDRERRRHHEHREKRQHEHHDDRSESSRHRDRRQGIQK